VQRMMPLIVICRGAQRASLTEQIVRVDTIGLPRTEVLRSMERLAVVMSCLCLNVIHRSRAIGFITEENYPQSQGRNTSCVSSANSRFERF